MTDQDTRKYVTSAVMDAIANELADRTILPSGIFLEEPILQDHISGAEAALFIAYAGGVRNPVQVRVTVEVLP